MSNVRRQVTQREERDTAFRIGAASIGLFAGLALGFIVGACSTKIAPCVFGGAAAGLLTGLIYPEVALRIAELTIHFFAGLFSGVRGLALEDTVEASSAQIPGEVGWLKAAFIFGVAFSVILALLVWQ